MPIIKNIRLGDNMDLVDKYLGEGAKSWGGALARKHSNNPAGVDVQKALMKKQGVDWKDFYKMSKDTSGKTFKEYEKKYGKMYVAPHIKDALDKAKNFKDFERMIKKFEK